MSFHWKCQCCREPYLFDDLLHFEVDEKTCSISRAVHIGTRTVHVCKKCLRVMGEPKEIYLGHTIWSIGYMDVEATLTNMQTNIGDHRCGYFHLYYL